MKVAFKVDLDIDLEEFEAPVDGDVKSSVKESLEYCLQEMELIDGITVSAVRSA